MSRKQPKSGRRSRPVTAGVAGPMVRGQGIILVVSIWLTLVLGALVVVIRAPGTVASLETDGAELSGGATVCHDLSASDGACIHFARAAGPSPTSTPPPSTTPPSPASTESVMHVAAVGDIHGPGVSPVAAATAAEAAKADFILGLGDYQYQDGAMSKYNSYFDKDWGPNVPKMYPVLAPHHDRNWADADPLKYFNGRGAHGYKSPIRLRPYTPYSFDNGDWHFIALPDTCARTRGCRIATITSWLQHDLDTHTNHCTIAYWHQPYFTSTSGSHGQEASIKPWVDLLVARHVDIILQGHNHFYERFAPQNAARQAAANGPQAFVVGTGGVGLHRFKDTAPNSVTRNAGTYGVLQLTLKEGSYDWKFVPVAGGTYTDSGSMTCR